MGCQFSHQPLYVVQLIFQTKLICFLDPQVELGLSKQDIAKRIQSQLNTEYAERAFEIIENSGEVEQLTLGLGRLLVAQARSILIMRSVVDKLTDDLEEHMETVNKT